MSELSGSSQGRPRAHPPAALVHAALVSVQLGFSTLPVAGKIAFRYIPPDGVVFARVLAGATAFAALQVLLGRSPLVPRADWPRLAGLAFLGVIVNQLLFLRGLAHTTAINATVIGTTIPIFTVLIALALGRERRRWALLAGVVLAVAGVLYLIGAEAFAVGATTVAGDLMIVVNAASYAAFLVLGRDMARQHGAVRMMASCFLVAALAVAPLGGPALVAALPTLPRIGWAALLWILVVPTVYVYLANTWALRHAESSLVAIYIYLQPIGAALLAVPILGERLSSRTGIAAACVFAGIALVTFRSRRPPGPAGGVETPTDSTHAPNPSSAAKA